MQAIIGYFFATMYRKTKETNRKDDEKNRKSIATVRLWIDNCDRKD